MKRPGTVAAMVGVATLVPAVVTNVLVPARAAAVAIVAGPGAQTAGYATPVVYLPQGAEAQFENTDSLNQHDVVSDAKGPDGAPLFRSELDSLYLPDPEPVAGTADLEPGSYAFHCSLHPNMTGELIVQTPGDGPAPADPGPFDVPMPVPPTLDGSDISLDIREAEVPVLPGQPTRMYTYDGMFPGPTIRRPAGRPTRVTFTNELTTFGADATVHRHGGHNTSGDDGQPDRNLIPPGAGRTYTYDLTEGGQPERAAFEWYHDHKLDKTGEHLWRGLAGMFIVDDPVDSALPLPKGEFDVPIMLAERSFDADNQLTDPFVGRTPPGDEVVGDQVLANGRHQPHFEVADRRYRFRILNGSNFTLYNLRLSNGAPLVQIGTESGLLPEPVTRDTILLGPAERAEVVVDFAGMLGRDVILESVPRTDERGPRGLGAGSKTAALLQFRVTRHAEDDSRVPATLRPAPELDASPTPTPGRHWVAGLGYDSERSGTAWTINGHSYDGEVVDATPVVGSTETWMLTNPTHVSHVIHIHGTDWLVLSRDGEPPPAWEDGLKETFLLDPGETMTVAARFTDHTGRFVIHCHMLEHEDHGMMGQYEVLPTGDPPEDSDTAAPAAYFCPIEGWIRR